MSETRRIYGGRPIELIPAKDGWTVTVQFGESEEMGNTFPVIAWARIEGWYEDEDGYVESGSEWLSVQPLYSTGHSYLAWPDMATQRHPHLDINVSINAPGRNS